MERVGGQRGRLRLAQATVGSDGLGVKAAIALRSAPNGLVIVVNPDTREGVLALAVARVYLLQHSLTQWVGYLNVTHSTAPT